MATLRMKATAKDLLENAGKSVSQAMTDNGYKPGYAKNPQELTKTKGWQELLEEKLPDTLLADKNVELLNKMEFIAIGKKGEREVLETGQIDPYAVAKGLEIALKLKNKFPAIKFSVTNPVEEMTDEELNNQIIALEESVKKRSEAKSK